MYHYYAFFIADVSNTTGYELEVFRGHLVRAMTCPTLIIPVFYSMGITTAALGKEQLQYYYNFDAALETFFLTSIRS